MINRLSEIFAKVRVKAWKIFNKIILGSTAGGLPLSSIRSLEEVLYKEFINNHVADIITIYEPNIVKYNFPKEYPSYFRRSKTFEKRCLYFLKDVCISPDSGMAWLPEGYVLNESVGSLLRIMDWGGIMHELLLPVNELRSQKPIVACPPTGYFHWLFEIMPNILHVLSKVPEGKILISTKSPNYVLNALELLIGHEKYKSKIIVSRHPLKIANLIMPQVEVYSGFVNPKDIEKLRIDFRGKVDKTEDNTTGFYYISRSQTKKRKLSNEIELEQRLKDLGFKIIYAEDMLFRDQIICFLKARFIIGPHGAGLSNMIWANSPCEINEIFPFGVFNDCYARLAVTLGFGYDYISCEQDKNGVGYIPIDEIIKKIQIKLNGFM